MCLDEFAKLENSIEEKVVHGLDLSEGIKNLYEIR